VCRAGVNKFFNPLGGHQKILGLRRTRWRKFYTEASQILWGTATNYATTVIWRPGFVHPCFRGLPFRAVLCLLLYGSCLLKPICSSVTQKYLKFSLPVALSVILCHGNKIKGFYTPDTWGGSFWEAAWGGWGWLAATDGTSNTKQHTEYQEVE